MGLLCCVGGCVLSTELPLEFVSATCKKAVRKAGYWAWRSYETCAKSLILPATHHFTITTTPLQLCNYSENVASFLLKAADVVYVEWKPSLWFSFFIQLGFNLASTSQGIQLQKTLNQLMELCNVRNLQFIVMLVFTMTFERWWSSAARCLLAGTDPDRSDRINGTSATALFSAAYSSSWSLRALPLISHWNVSPQRASQRATAAP